MANSGFETLSESDAQGYIQAYFNSIDNAADDDSVLSLFQVPSTNVPLFGFELIPSDFIELLSYSGITQWQFHFGYDSNAGNGESRFKLILHGRDDSGSLRSLYYVLNNPITTDPNFPSSTSTYEPTTFLGRTVPYALVYNWGKSWSNLVTGTALNSVFCKMNVYEPGMIQTSVLKGYTYNYADLLGVINPTNLTANSRIKIWLVNHATVDANQNGQPGIVGLLMATYLDNTIPVDNPLSAFFDFSAPCPPTCLN